MIHTGDFKVDLSPPDGKAFDLSSFAEYGKRGVLALLQDSTNVDRAGYTPSEWAVRPRLDEIFARTKRRLFFSCFSSSIYRLRIALELAQSHGRKVAIVGRSMLESSEIAQDLGYLDIPRDLLIHPGQIKDFGPEEICVLISGTQGEPMSALSRAAVDNHKHAKIERGDTVLLSSRVIPGNEKSIYRVIDHLCRREANVIFDDGQSGLIHVSGHGSQEELRLMINLVRPKFFVPIHGDFRHLQRHARLAMDIGISENAYLLEDGDILELDQNTAVKKGKVAAGRVLLDSGASGNVVEDMIIRDRRHLSEDGLVIAIITINKLTGPRRRRAGVRDARLRRRRSRTGRAGKGDRRENARRIERRGTRRPGADQGEDPRRPEALHPKADVEPALHHADHPRDLIVAIAKTDAQTELVTAVQFAEARERLRDAVLHTPLVRISSVTEAVAYLKAESLQPIGSFKLRGAFNAVAQLNEAQRQRGVITYSSGNHGQGVAYAARAFGVPRHHRHARECACDQARGDNGARRPDCRRRTRQLGAA